MSSTSIKVGDREIADARQDKFKVLDKKYKSLFKFLQLELRNYNQGQVVVITFTYKKVHYPRPSFKVMPVQIFVKAG